MKRYRLGFDYLFLAEPSISYKENYIGATVVRVLLQIFDHEGEEMFFNLEQCQDQKLFYEGGSCYISDLLICSFDKETILNFKLNMPLLKEFKGDLHVQWEINSYTKEIYRGTHLEPEVISEEEFMEIMRSNSEAFDNSDNTTAQTPAYFTKEVENQEKTDIEHRLDTLLKEYYAKQQIKEETLQSK